LHDEGILAVGAEFAAGIFEEEKGRGVFAGASIGIHGGGEELDGDDVGVGRPGERFDLVGEEFIVVSEFLAFQETFALAAGFEEPDVVALEIVFFGFEHAADGEDDVAVGGVGEGGDFFVDVGDGFVEVLGESGSGEVKEVEEVKEVKERIAGEFGGRG
jgi:hypothetical protein